MSFIFYNIICIIKLINSLSTFLRWIIKIAQHFHMYGVLRCHLLNVIESSSAWPKPLFRYTSTIFGSDWQYMLLSMCVHFIMACVHAHNSIAQIQNVYTSRLCVCLCMQCRHKKIVWKIEKEEKRKLCGTHHRCECFSL